jgi:hypothetical protein
MRWPQLSPPPGPAARHNVQQAWGLLAWARRGAARRMRAGGCASTLQRARRRPRRAGSTARRGEGGRAARGIRPTAGAAASGGAAAGAAGPEAAAECCWVGWGGAWGPSSRCGRGGRASVAVRGRRWGCRECGPGGPSARSWQAGSLTGPNLEDAGRGAGAIQAEAPGRAGRLCLFCCFFSSEGRGAGGRAGGTSKKRGRVWDSQR